MPIWTEPDAVTKVLNRRWKSGELLRVHAGLASWDPVVVPIAGPRAAEMAGSFDEVRAWVARWSEAASKRRFQLETRTVGGRLVGQNVLPARAHVGTLDGAWVLLGARRDVELFDRLLAQTPDGPLTEWVRENPIMVLDHAAVWSTLLSAVDWIESRDDRVRYLRQIDAAGVDTKFVAAHKGILTRMLDRVLRPERINALVPAGSFERRFGFATKPDYIRWRHLGRPAAGFSEMTVRADELAADPPKAARVIVVENEISYLALPDRVNTIAVFSAGYNLARFAQQSWLADTDVRYWGDLDTHGFAILHEFRRHVPQTESILMDRHTLLAHRAHWSQEPSPARADLPLLTAAERELYEGLLSNSYDQNVRLEQERVRFSAVESAIDAL